MLCEASLQGYSDKNKLISSKELEAYITYKTRGASITNKANLNNLIRIKHRRKNNQNDIRKSFVPTWKKCSFAENQQRGRLSCISDSPQKERLNKHMKRNTHHVFQDSESNSCNRVSQMREKSRPRMKLSIFQDICCQKISTKNIVFGANRQEEQKIKQPLQGKVKFLRLISKQFNKTTSNFTKNFEAEPLVDLIQKFKFQNLKTVSKLDSPRVETFTKYDKFPQSPSNQKPILFSNNEASKMKVRLLNQREKMNKTEMNWKKKQAKPDKSKVFTSLTPWQGQGLEFAQVSEFY